MSCGAVSQDNPVIGFSNDQLVIKTAVAAGSVKANEFGNYADWVELHNSGNSVIDFSEQKWYISDNKKRLKKYRLKKQQVQPNKSIIVWCDDEDRVKKENHTNFKLSSRGETIYLSKKEGNTLIIIDSLSYDALNTKGEVAVVNE